MDNFEKELYKLYLIKLKTEEKLFKRYKILTNNKLSIGVRFLMLKSIK